MYNLILCLKKKHMIYLNQTYELLTGGFHKGNNTWNKLHTEIDNCFKLYQLTEGSAYVCSEQSEFRLEKGKMYFINGSKLVKQYCKEQFSTYWMHFLPKDLMIYQALLELPAVVEIQTTTLSLINLEKSLDLLLDYINIKASSWEYALSIMKVQTLIQNAVMQLTQNCNISTMPTQIFRLEPAVHYINANYKENIHLEELACKCNVSPNYFHKIFKQTFRITPANYIILLRMNAALQLLKDNRSTIKDIAFELGFTDNAHFCKTFKKYYSITPKEYQRSQNMIL